MRPFRTKALQNLASQSASQSPKPNPNLQIDVNARIIKTGFDPNMFRFNIQIRNLLRKGELDRARQVFDEMPHRNEFSREIMIKGYVKSGDLSKARELFDTSVKRLETLWTVLIRGYSKNMQFREALEIFAEMCRCGVEADYVTLADLLSGFPDSGNVNEVLQLHSRLVKSGCISACEVSNSLIASYCKTHCLDLACRFFEEMEQKDSIDFNALIRGRLRDGLNKDVIKLFLEMRKLGLKPSNFTFSAVVCAANRLDDTFFGHQLHAFVVKTNIIEDVFVGNALLDFYSKHELAINARKLFHELPVLDAVSYNVIITGYARDGKLKECFDLFRELQFTKFGRRQFPFATLLSIAANTLDLEMGREIHAQAIVSGAISEVQVGNSLVDLYAKCNKFNEARLVFAGLAHKSAVPWTTMISAYVQNGLYEEGLSMFSEMRRASVSADQSTLATVLRASASLASLSLGQQVHSLAIKSGFLSHVYSGTALVDLYAKCGSIKNAVQAFQEMPERNLVSWNAMLSAFAQNGDGPATVRLFEQMLHSGLMPDSVSFLNVLTACSRSGLVEEGLKYFTSMNQQYKIVQGTKHYASMLDTLCRSARFNEAEKFIAEMPFPPNEVMWTSVLNACRIHKNREMGQKAAQNLINMPEGNNAGAYVNMSNIYASAGEWESAGNVKKAMRDRGVKKTPGYSWVEIKHETHVFASNDKQHPEMESITSKIEELSEQMGAEGYKVDTSCDMHNVDEESKAESLKYHSERLALAYVLISTPEGTPVLIMKNLRACNDCHGVIKVVSKIVGREITVRDSSRFHHFKNGICSCGDFW